MSFVFQKSIRSQVILLFFRRYAHVANKTEAAFEHYTHRLTGNVLREFISWELWNSLPSRLLVSILSKRLMSYVIQHMSQPGWINYRLISLFASEKNISILNLYKYSYISLFDVNVINKQIKHVEAKSMAEKTVENNLIDGTTPQLSPVKSKPICLNGNDAEVTKMDAVIQSDPDSIIEKALTKMITQHTAPILQRAEKNQQENDIVSFQMYLFVFIFKVA